MQSIEEKNGYLKLRNLLGPLGRAAALSVVLVTLFSCNSEENNDKKVSVNNSTIHPTVELIQPRGKTRLIDFTVDEGTNMSVDISPDGQWIIFDLLGHIYTMPAEGGIAICLTQNSGPSINSQPRYSPDGQQIVFISDRGGQENIWLMDKHGGSVRPVYQDLYARYREPSWSGDGKTLYVRRSEQTAYVSNSEIWAYPAKGGEGKALRQRKGKGQSPSVFPRDAEFFSPSIGPQGEYLYYTALYPILGSVTTGADAYVQRLNLNTGELEFLPHRDGIELDPAEGSLLGVELKQSVEILGYPVRGPLKDRNFQAEVSPDGRFLAYVRTLDGTTMTFGQKHYGPGNALYLYELATGMERKLVDLMSIDLARSAGTGWYGVSILPRYAWAKDSASIIFSAEGNIQRVSIDKGSFSNNASVASSTVIPFTARVQRQLSEQVLGQLDINDNAFTASFLRWPSLSPDRSELVFEAAGRLWLQAFPEGLPRALIGDLGSSMQYTPSWSPDGKAVAFTTGDSIKGGHVWTLTLATGEVQRLTRTPGHYIYPVWLHDGNTIAVNSRLVTGEAFSYIGSRYPAANEAWHINLLPAEGGELSRIYPVITESKPQLADDGHLVVEASNGNLVKINTQGAEQSQLLTLRYANQAFNNYMSKPYGDPQLSPDGNRVAVVIEQKVYVALVDKANGDGPTPLQLVAPGSQSTCLANKPGKLCLTNSEGGLYPRWVDQTTLELISGTTHILYDAVTGTVQRTPITLTIPRPKVTGKIAFTGAQLITLEGEQLIESGTLIVSDRRILCVGSCDISGVDRVMDMTGKTIIPGLIDTHGHELMNRRTMYGPKYIGLAAMLAYGVTTLTEVHDGNQNALAIKQMVDAGTMIGPRLLTTGPVMFGTSEAIQHMQTLDDARQLVNRRLDWGASYVKPSQLSSRWKYQLIAQAAHERGATVTVGHDDLHHLIAAAIDGVPGWEHIIFEGPIHRDVIEFMGRANMMHTPTLIVMGHESGSQHYYRAQEDLLKDKKYQRFMPLTDIQRAVKRTAFIHTCDLEHKSLFSFPVWAQGIAEIFRAGGYVGVGSHGEQAGIGVHWEMQGLAEAMSPIEVLTAASKHGARWLGIGHETGSLRSGKLADLVILNTNPLDDIRNAKDIAYVMKAGVLYNDDTLDEIWPQAKKFGTVFPAQK